LPQPTSPTFTGRVKLMDIPDEIIEEYKLREKATADGCVHFKVLRGMYGLPQAGSNSHDELEEHLNKEGYSKALSPLPYGSTRHTQLNFYWSSMILESILHKGRFGPPG
jgi:hypothetical protein